jgi:hypothetical protein
VFTTFNCTIPFRHTVGAAGVTTGAVGVASTFTVAVLVQPVAVIVPVTVYVVLKTGFAITVAPVVTFSPAAGAQLYVFAVPEAVIVSGLHLLFPVTEIVGAGFTVKVAAVEFTLPQGDVTTAL